MSEVQVDKSHYAIGDYGFEGRFVSYYWQLFEVLSRIPARVLEVGVGDGVFGNFIRDNTPVEYISADIAEDLHPDVLASVTSLPFSDGEFDIACAFEVLEHIPFEQFEPALAELARVAKGYLVISLPHFGPMLSFSLKIPLLPQLQAAWKVPYPRTHAFNGQHYWEIGKRGYPAARIRKAIAVHGTIERDYVPFNSPYHHFFVVKLPG